VKVSIKKMWFVSSSFFGFYMNIVLKMMKIKRKNREGEEKHENN